jgi:tyrosyl-tRNA synthetase
MALALEITKMFWSEEEAQDAKTYFISVFQKKDIPDDMPVAKVAGMMIMEALVESKLAESRTDARRLIEQGGIKVDGKLVKSLDKSVKSGNVIQKGKRFFVKAE